MGVKGTRLKGKFRLSKHFMMMRVRAVRGYSFRRDSEDLLMNDGGRVETLGDDRDLLKMSVKMCPSWSSGCPRARPGVFTAPAALRGLM